MTEEIEPVEAVEATALTPEQIAAQARRMITHIEHSMKISFMDHWLTKLNLTDTVTTLENRGTIHK